MARQFAADQYFEKASYAALPAGTPFTLSCWAKADSFADWRVPFTLRNAGNTKIARLLVNGSGQTQAQAIAPGQSGLATTGSSGSTGTWYRLTAVFTATGRLVYRDNVAAIDVTATVDLTSGLTHVAVGSYPGFYDWLGAIADAAVWDVDISPDDQAALAAGYSAISVRPDALVGWWPLFGRGTNEENWVGPDILTPSGTPTVTDAPRLIYPRRRTVFLPVAAAPSFNPAWAIAANSVVSSGASAA